MNNGILALNARECLSVIIKAVKSPEKHPDIFETIFTHILSYIPQ